MDSSTLSPLEFMESAPKQKFITEVDNKPWVNHESLAQALGYSDPKKLVELYSRNLEEFTQGDVFEFSPNLGENPQGGRPTKTYLFSEEGAVLLCMFARTPQAREARKQIKAVFVAWRQGKLVHPTSPTINMTLPDGTKLEGLPVSSIQHLIPQAVTPTVATSTIQPTLGLKEERKPGETVFHLESAVSHMESGWYTLVEVARQIGCQPKTLNHKLLKRKLPKRWGSRWDKGKWWVYLP
jgi:hypothetical protein